MAGSTLQNATNSNFSHDENIAAVVEAKRVPCSMQLPTAKLFISGMFVVLGGGFNFGFQISVINPMAEPLQRFLSQSLKSHYGMHLSELPTRVFWSFVAGILFIGAVIGASIMPAVTNRIGSRRSFILIGTMMVIGVAFSPISKFTNSAELFILSRIIVGICVGMGTTLQGVFLTEISPVSCRGLMGTLTGLSTNIGVLVSSAVGLPQIFGSDTFWEYAYYVEMIPCSMLILYAYFVLHESPLYFIQKKMDENLAKKSIEFYHQKTDDSEQIIRELKKQQQAQNDLKHIGWLGLCKDRATRKALCISLLLNGTVSFSGIIAMVFFGTFLLAAIGFTSRGAALANCLAGLSGTVGVLVGAIAIDQVGRRVLLVASMTVLILVNVGMMVLVWMFRQYFFALLGYCFLLLYIIFLFVFSVGVGPLSWFISTELAGPASRAQVQSLSISTQYITCFLCPVIYLPLEQLIGPFSFLIFIIPLAFTAFYIYRYMPETRNRYPEEIRRLLEN